MAGVIRIKIDDTGTGGAHLLIANGSTSCLLGNDLYLDF